MTGPGQPSGARDAEAAKRELRERGWYVRYTEWPSGHQVVLHRRSDPATHLVTPWFPTEAEAWDAALAIAGGPAHVGVGARDVDVVRDLDLVIVGAASAELAVRAGRLPRAGEMVRGDLLLEGPGCEGARLAIAAARLGARVALLARVGADRRGDEVLSRLREQGIEIDRVEREAGAATPVALVHLDRRGRRSEALLAGRGAPGGLSPGAVRDAAETIGRGAVLVAALDVPTRSIAEALRIARARGAQTVLDAAPARRIPERLLALADVVRVGARGAEAAIGTRVRGRRSAVAAARTLVRRGAALAAVDLPGDGAALVTRGEILWMPAAATSSGDPAAGAAFCAALAVALGERLDLAEAGGLACAASSAASTADGVAGLPARAQLSRIATEAPAPTELLLDGLSARNGPSPAAGRGAGGERPGDAP